MTAMSVSPLVLADFISDARTSVSARNFYYHQDLSSAKSVTQSKIDEWAQGFMLKSESGYTDTPVAFGVDVYAGLGIKLDSSPDRSGSGLLPGAYDRAGGARDADPRSVDEYSEATGALKAKISATELKVGGLFPKNPLIASSDGRLLPQYFQGAMLIVKEWENIELLAGQFNRANHREFTGMQKLQAGNFLAYDSDKFTYEGATWKHRSGLSAEVWNGELEDIYQQVLYSVSFNTKVSDWRLGTTVNHMISSEAGEKLAGSIDNKISSALISVGKGPGTLRLSYQKNTGTDALPYIYETDLPALPSFIQVLRFDRAQEQSWQVRYDYDFAAIGLPGLQAMARYVDGSNIRLATGRGEEWERDLDLSYVVQSGALKDFSVRVRNAALAGDVTGKRVETRIILGYTFTF